MNTVINSVLHLSSSFIFIFIVANFSFKPIDTLNEDSPFVEICVFVQDGDIIRHMITLLLDTMDGTAMGNYKLHVLTMKCSILCVSDVDHNPLPS